eukprot:COSAG02_NODE_1478_length_12404_cov_353.335067_13_plen_203_part_00
MAPAAAAAAARNQEQGRSEMDGSSAALPAHHHHHHHHSPTAACRSIQRQPMAASTQQRHHSSPPASQSDWRDQEECSGTAALQSLAAVALQAPQPEVSSAAQSGPPYSPCYCYCCSYVYHSPTTPTTVTPSGSTSMAMLLASREPARSRLTGGSVQPSRIVRFSNTDCINLACASNAAAAASRRQAPSAVHMLMYSNSVVQC